MSTDPLQPTSRQIRKPVTVISLRQKKERHERITMLTAYDYPTALILDEAGIDAILVGDSLGMVVLGYETTLPVTMDDMIRHCQAVARGAKSALLIGDMPFLSYQVSSEEAIRNAGRFMQEAGMQAVKLEGGRERLAATQGIIAAGIPVMGHLGLTPQSVNRLGGFRSQARTTTTALKLVEDADLLEQAGCFAVVLESVPARVAELISHRLTIPTIGIGAGSGCDGQVLVTHDMLGLFDHFTPKFVRKYADLHTSMKEAFAAYINDVQAGQFPSEEHAATIPNEEWELLLKEMN